MGPVLMYNYAVSTFFRPAFVPDFLGLPIGAPTLRKKIKGRQRRPMTTPTLETKKLGAVVAAAAAAAAAPRAMGKEKPQGQESRRGKRL